MRKVCDMAPRFEMPTTYQYVPTVLATDTARPVGEFCGIRFFVDDALPPNEIEVRSGRNRQRFKF